MSQQVTGKVKIKIDGTVIESENEATLNPGGVTRDPQSHGGKTYFSESDVPPELTFKVLLTKDVDVININAWKDKTVTFIADTGQRYLIRKAFTTNVVEHGKESAEVKMSGNKAEKV